MLIEAAILIKADLMAIWKTFIDLTSWNEWNTIARGVASDSGRIVEGERFRFRLWFSLIPVHVEVKIREVTTHENIIWTSSKFGIFSSHEFLFQQTADGVLVTSRETFRGLPLLFGIGNRNFPEGKVRELTIGMLNDLKKAAEKRLKPE